MTEKKFHIPSIILAVVAVLLEFFVFIAEGAIVAIIALIICAKKRETHRTKIGVVLSIIALLLGIATFSFFMYIFSRSEVGYFETGYWLIDLFLK